jgi:hypothetical protein
MLMRNHYARRSIIIDRHGAIIAHVRDRKTREVAVHSHVLNKVA